MARTDSLENFLTDVATAIKAKKGNNVDIQASDFDTEIANLPGQGVYQNKSIQVTTNGTQIITPDTNYDALLQVEVNVNVPTNEDVTLIFDTGSTATVENGTLILDTQTGGEE